MVQVRRIPAPEVKEPVCENLKMGEGHVPGPYVSHDDTLSPTEYCFADTHPKSEVPVRGNRYGEGIPWAKGALMQSHVSYLHSLRL